MDMSIQPTQRGTVHHLAGLDTVLAYDDSPDPAFPLIGRIARMTNDLVALDAKVAAIRRDPHLSPAGRQAKMKSLDPDFARISAEVATVDAALDDLEALNAVHADAVVEVPPLDRTDSVGYLYDRERRDFVAGLTGDRRTRFMEELTAGKHPDVAVALARSPVPTPERQIGLATYRASLSNENQQELQTLDVERVGIEWARSVTGAMRNILRRSTSDAPA